MTDDRLKESNAVFIYEATDDDGRIITGETEAQSAAAVRELLTAKGYRVTRVGPDQRTPEERAEEDRESVERAARIIVEQGLRSDASTIRVARRRSRSHPGITVSDLIDDEWHEVMAISGDQSALMWRDLRDWLANRAGVDLRPEAARQRGTIPWTFEGRGYALQVAFRKTVIRMGIAGPA
jgi:hypothetical protein